ncbi:MAG: GNAT family N-acetyltransferase [Pseudomonadales bacterium]|jgi:CelD/BcsL family acetyltransferase involved in cellulose biosynthesis|nr:GNAT family N-acetyltransferase [Pseudomonadales bacterium]
MAQHWQVFAGSDGLRALTPAWEALAVRAGTSFLHHPAWYGAQLATTPASDDDTLFFARHEGDRLVAVVPAVFTAEARDDRLPLDVHFACWELAYHSEMGLRDATVDPSLVRAELVDSLREAFDERAPADLVRFRNLPASSRLLTAARRAPAWYTLPSHGSKYLDTSASHDALMARYSGKYRRNLRRKLTKLESLGHSRVELVTREPELGRAFEAFLEVESSGWKGERGTSIARQPAQRAYYEHLLAGLARTGHALITLLWLDDRCIAGQFAVRAGRTVHLLRIGYDESLAAVSPGALLLDALLQHACACDGVDRVSFVTGIGWMDAWKPEVEPVENVYAFGRSLKGRYLQTAILAHGYLKARTGPGTADTAA